MHLIQRQNPIDLTNALAGNLPAVPVERFALPFISSQLPINTPATRGRVGKAFAMGLSATGETGMNPMHPSSEGIASPLPLPNHPNGTLAGGWEGGEGGRVIKHRMNPMHPLSFGLSHPMPPSRQVEPEGKCRNI